MSDQPIEFARLLFAALAVLYTVTVSVIIVAGNEDPISPNNSYLMGR